MKYKRYCINIDQSILYATFWSLAWTVLVLVIFLLRLLVNGSRNMDTFWVDFLVDGELFWYLSGPILLFVSAIISVFFIVFPVSYVEFHNDFMLVHRAFKEDRIIKYETIQFSRLRPNRRKKMFLIYFSILECDGELNTVEVRSSSFRRTFWFSSTKTLYVRLAKILRNDKSRQMVEDKTSIADAEWIKKNGNPNDLEWGGYFGKYP